MRMIIEESAINDFNIIEELASNRKRCLSSFLDIDAPPSQIIESFQTLSQRRPKLRKLGIYTKISLKNLYVSLQETSCQQILSQYIRGIGWDDLQYISFFETASDCLYIHIIFNRVTPEARLIDLNCLGASWQQYEVLRKSCYQIIQNSLSTSRNYLNSYVR
jgi:hypothetical protein